MNIKCEKCGNTELKYFGKKDNKYYCRKCISFNGEKVSNFTISTKDEIKLEIDYRLSKVQDEIARKILSSALKKEKVLVYAVTGAGKTELVYYSIANFLQRGCSVGFAIPRKDVVIDLYPRIKNAFPKAKTVSLYQNHTFDLKGDITILTTHQLYRFNKYFDLLIIDEIDAFPFKNNSMLEYFLQNSSKGSLIYLSATPSKEEINYFQKNGKVYEIFERYHHHKLPVPFFYKKKVSLLVSLLFLMKKLISDDKQLFIFVPTILIGETIFPILKRIYKNGEFVHSLKNKRNEIIEDFKDKKYSYLITTAILERGVTVKNLQVIVYMANHDLYTKEGLIQIAGRVGRKKDAPTGHCYFLGEYQTNAIYEAINEIRRSNLKAGL